MRRLYWEDNFDGPFGSAADERIWHAQVGGHGWGNEELQYYTAGKENAFLDGEGSLSIVVHRLDASLSAYGNRFYTSARLTTRDRFSIRYGLIQARMKLPQAFGLWPAF